MKTNITIPTENNNFSMQQLINIVGQSAMTMQGISTQLGIVATKVTTMEIDMMNMKDEIFQLKNNEEITTEQSATITATAKKRIRTILGEDEFEYQKYARRFFGRLWSDAKLYGGVGDKVSRTRKCNYQKAINYIEAWIPLGGINKFKQEIDIKAQEKIKAKNMGYDV